MGRWENWRIEMGDENRDWRLQMGRWENLRMVMEDEHRDRGGPANSRVEEWEYRRRRRDKKGWEESTEIRDEKWKEMIVPIWDTNSMAYLLSLFPCLKGNNHYTITQSHWTLAIETSQEVERVRKCFVMFDTVYNIEMCTFRRHATTLYGVLTSTVVIISFSTLEP